MFFLSFRLNFSTPLSTNAVSICKSIGLSHVTRIETSVRYQVRFSDCNPPSDVEERLVHSLHDRMTQCRYLEPVKSFELQKPPEPLFDIDIMGEGKTALARANKELGRACGEQMIHVKLCRTYFILESITSFFSTFSSALIQVNFNFKAVFFYLS